jgi:hypothetical protein
MRLTVCPQFEVVKRNVAVRNVAVSNLLSNVLFLSCFENFGHAAARDSRVTWLGWSGYRVYVSVLWAEVHRKAARCSEVARSCGADLTTYPFIHVNYARQIHRRERLGCGDVYKLRTASMSRASDSGRVRDDMPVTVSTVGNRPRSNGCLVLSTGCAFVRSEVGQHRAGRNSTVLPGLQRGGGGHATPNVPGLQPPPSAASHIRPRLHRAWRVDSPHFFSGTASIRSASAFWNPSEPTVLPL